MAYIKTEIGDTGQNIIDNLHTNFTLLFDKIEELQEDIDAIETIPDGGTEGQPLVKATSDNQDVTWGTVPLGIYQTTESEFWEGFNEGTIPTGLYQYDASVVGFESMFDEQMFFSTSHDRSVTGILSHNRLFMGNAEINDSTRAGIIVADEDGSNAQLISYGYGYTHHGLGAGGIGIDDDGFIYVSCQPANIMSINAGNPFEPGGLSMQMTYGYGAYIFNSVSYNMNHGAAILPRANRESLAVADGGIFAISDTARDPSVRPIIYCRSGHVVAGSELASTLAFNRSHVCVDYDNSLLYCYWPSTSAIWVYNVHCGVEVTFNLPNAPGAVITQNQGGSRIFVRNGIVFLVMNYSIAGSVIPFLVSHNPNTNVTVHHRCTGYTGNSWTTPNVSISTHDTGSALLVTVAGTSNMDPLGYYRWDYSTNTFSEYLGVGVSNPWNLNDFTEVNGNICMMYQSYANHAPAGFRMDVIDPSTMTLAFSYTTNEQVNAEIMEPFQTSDGTWFAVGYAHGRGVVLRIHPNGDMDIINKEFTLPNRTILTEFDDLLIVQSSNMSSSAASYSINKNNLALTYLNTNNVPAIKVNNGFIYYDGTTLLEPATKLLPMTRLVSNGKVARIEFDRV